MLCLREYGITVRKYRIQNEDEGKQRKRSRELCEEQDARMKHSAPLSALLKCHYSRKVLTLVFFVKKNIILALKSRYSTLKA
jgi:hypothetical protein